MAREGKGLVFLFLIADPKKLIGFSFTICVYVVVFAIASSVFSLEIVFIEKMLLYVY